MAPKANKKVATSPRDYQLFLCSMRSKSNHINEQDLENTAHVCTI